MAATDARPLPRKNTAYRVYFPILDADGDPVTGAAGLDSEVSLDGGAFTDCVNEATEIGNSGLYYLDLTAAEMNADAVIIRVQTSTSGAKTTAIFLYPEEEGDFRIAPASIRSAVGLSSANLDTQLTAIDTTVGAVKAKTDNLPAAPAAQSDIPSAATVAGQVRTELATELARIDAAVSTRASQASLNTAQSTLDKVDDMLELDGAVYRFTANALEQAPTGSGGGSAPSAEEVAEAVRSELTTELGRIDVAISSRLADEDYVAPLDAAGIRGAVGLASANLDTQLSTIDNIVDAIKAKTDQLTFTLANKVDASIQAAGDFAQAAADKVWSSATRTLSAFGFSVTVGTNNDKSGYSLSSAGIQAIWDALTSALTLAGSIGKLLVDNINATISSRATQTSVDTVDNVVDAVKAKTDQLTFSTTNRVDATAVAVSDKTGYSIGVGGIGASAFAAGAINAAALSSDAVDEILDEQIGDGTLTVRQALKVAVAVLAGKLSGAATSTITIRNVADTTDVVVATVDEDGNRNAITLTV